MRHRGLKRLVALTLVAAMLGSTVSVFAEDLPTATDTDAEESITASSGTASQGSDYNERLEKNYTNVSAAYTAPEYTGSQIVVNAAEAWDSSSAGSLVEGYDYLTSVVQLESEGTTRFIFDVDKAGVYQVGFEYKVYDESSILDGETSLVLNGETPFYEAKTLTFPAMWNDASEKQYDNYGNEVVAQPVKSTAWLKKYVDDSSGRYSGPLLLELQAGENTIELTLKDGSVRIGAIYLEAPEGELPTYTTQVSTGKQHVEMQAEQITVRNDSSIRANCEYDCNLTPYETSLKVLNLLDGSSFLEAGQMVTYEFNIEEDGVYYFAYRYRQADKADFPVFMDISIDEYNTDGSLKDGEKIQFSNMKDYEFYTCTNFEVETMTDKASGEYIGIPLTAGSHTITLSISNDHIRQALETVDIVMNEISDLSLQITKVVGSNTDKYRSIDISEYISDVDILMAAWIQELQDEYDNLCQYSKVKEPGVLASLKIAISQLTSLAKEPNKIPYRLAELSTSSSSVSQYLATFITDITNNATSFDWIYAYEGDYTLPKDKGIFTSFWEAVKRFFASFTSQAYSVDNVDTKHLQVWVNRSRQYIEIIQRLINNSFTPETGIQVDLCIMPDAQKLILANAAGEAPDVALGVDYSLPYDLAIRGALADMTKFEGYQETLSQVPVGLLVPGAINDSIYAIPETFYFWVLYYRTDILEKLGLEVPDTMEDVKNMLPDLKNRGLDFYYPTAGTTGQRTLSMTTPLIYQYGGSVYGATAQEGTTINSSASIEGLTELTELFTIYDIPEECTSFYQHFRNGDIPIGVSDYFMYNMLINAAPEIENSWEISLVPGVVDEYGVVQRQVAGGAQSDIIFAEKEGAYVTTKTGEHVDREEAAWKFISWWMDTDTQVEFGTVLQQTYGSEYIWNSANIEAFNQLPWKSDAKKVILEEMEWITETPRIPGTYMVERELSNAYIAVVNSGETLRTAVDSAVKNIDRETNRKLEEFGYTDSNGDTLIQYNIPTVESIKALLNK